MTSSTLPIASDMAATSTVKVREKLTNQGQRPLDKKVPGNPKVQFCPPQMNGRPLASEIYNCIPTQGNKIVKVSPPNQNWRRGCNALEYLQISQVMTDLLTPAVNKVTGFYQG